MPRIEVDPATELEPFPGARPFERRDEEMFFGRDGEANQLSYLVVAHSAVLLYAQSGAGKTSMINARLIPLLKDREECTVLNVARLHFAPVGRRHEPGRNLFVLHTLASWVAPSEEAEADDIEAEAGDTEANAAPVDDGLAGLTLCQYLEGRFGPEGERLEEPCVAIFDQFEEIFTADPDSSAGRRQFFEQIRDALARIPMLRVLFAIREDFLAALDPYAGLLPERLQTRYRLERMDGASALLAIKAPFQKAGRAIEDAVATALRDNLLGIHRNDQTPSEPPEDQFVELVQLQVVCRQLWESLGKNEKTVTEKHLAQVGDVDSALTRFYERCVAEAASDSGVKEGRIRRWIEDELITPAGTRAIVFWNPLGDGPIPKEVVALLDQRHLIRAERRGRDIWYELAHDRWVELVLASNRHWRTKWSDRALVDLEEKAARCMYGGGQLLEGAPLIEAEAFLQRAATEEVEPSEAVLEFVGQSRLAYDRKVVRERERQTAAISKAAKQEQAALREKEKALREKEAALEARRRADEERKAIEEAARRQTLEQMRELSRKDHERRAALAAEKTALEGQEQALREKQAALEAQRKADEERKAIEEAAQQAEEEALRRATEQAERIADAERERANAERERAEAADLANQEKRRTIIWMSVLLPLGFLLAAASLYLSSIAKDAALAAERKSQLLLASKLTSDSTIVRPTDPQLSLVLAADAVETLRNLGDPVDGDAKRDADEALRLALANSLLRRVLEDRASRGTSAAYSPDGTRVVAGCEDGAACIWEVNSGKRLARLLDGRPERPEGSAPPGSARVLAVAFSPDPQGRLVATGADDGKVRIWDGHSGAPFATIDGRLPAPPCGPVFDREGRRLVTLDRDGPSAKLWDWRSSPAKPIRTLTGHAGRLTGAAFSPDGRLVVTSSEDRTARVWDAETGRQVAKSPLHDGPVARAAFDPSSKIVVSIKGESPGAGLRGATVPAGSSAGQRARPVASGQPGGLEAGSAPETWGWVWEAETGRERFALRSEAIPEQDRAAGASTPRGGGHERRILCAAFSPDGRFLATGGQDARAIVWSLESSTQVSSASGHTGPVRDIDFDPESRFIVTSSDDQTARVWSAESGRPVSILKQHTGPVFAGKFGRGARPTIVTVADKVQIWDAGLGEVVAKLPRQADAARGGAFSPDGRRVVTYGRSASIWDPRAAGTGGGDPPSLALNGHDGQVLRAAFSPDGTRVVTAGADQTARVWEAGTGAAVLILQGHLADVNDATFSPDGSLVATAGADHTVRIWDARTGALRRELTGHRSMVTSVAFGADGSQVVTIGSDGEVNLWDASTWKRTPFPLASPSEPAPEVRSAVLSPDGKTLLIAGGQPVFSPAKGAAKVWGTGDRPSQAGLDELRLPISAAEFSPDGGVLATSVQGPAGAEELGTVRLWDPATGRPHRVPELRGHTDRVTVIAFSRDGSLLATEAMDGTGRVWDASNGACLATLYGLTGPNGAMVFSPDKRRIATEAGNQRIKVWDAATGKEEFALTGLGYSLEQLEFSPDGQLLLAGAMNMQPKIWDLNTRRLLPEPGGEPLPTATQARFSPDGKGVLVADWNSLELRDARTGKRLAAMALEGMESDDYVAFLADGRSVIAFGPRRALIWELGKEPVLRTRPDLAAERFPRLAYTFGTLLEEGARLLGKRIAPPRAARRPLSVSRDGKHVLMIGDTGPAWIWDLAHPDRSVQSIDPEGPIAAAVFSPDGSRLLVSSWAASQVRTEAIASAWDLKPEGGPRALEGHTDMVTAAAFSRDGRYAITAGMDSLARIWDTSTWRQVAELRGHEGPVLSAAFSPDWEGRYVVTAGEDRSARIWLSNTGTALVALHRATEPIAAAGLSPDLKTLLTSSRSAESPQAIVYRVLILENTHVLLGLDATRAARDSRPLTPKEKGRYHLK